MERSSTPTRRLRHDDAEGSDTAGTTTSRQPPTGSSIPTPASGSREQRDHRLRRISAEGRDAAGTTTSRQPPRTGSVVGPHTCQGIALNGRKSPTLLAGSVRSRHPLNRPQSTLREKVSTTRHQHSERHHHRPFRYDPPASSTHPSLPGLARGLVHVPPTPEYAAEKYQHDLKPKERTPSSPTFSP